MERQRELPTNGHLTSPNYPNIYPNDYNSVQKIQVSEGNTIWIRFDDFVCEGEFDTVTITDKDGTRLGFFDGEYNSDDNWRTKEMVSNTDTVEVHFQTDESGVRKGWRLKWGTYKDSITISCFFTFLISCFSLFFTLFHRNSWR